MCDAMLSRKTISVDGCIRVTQKVISVCMMVRQPLCFDLLEEAFLGPKGSLKSLDSEVSYIHFGHFF